MASFVVDASVALAWCFEDEASAWTDSLLGLLSGGTRVVVPAHWPVETANGLWTAERRQRIQTGRAEAFWDQLADLPIEAEPPLTSERAKHVQGLSRQYRLTAYDAAYLELAERRRIPLATMDSALEAAAKAAGVGWMGLPPKTGSGPKRSGPKQ